MDQKKQRDPFPPIKTKGQLLAKQNSEWYCCT